MGEPIAVVVAPEDQEHLPGILREIVEEGIWKGQLLHIREDGTTFPALESCFVTRNTAGEIETMVGMVRDISELLAAEEERLALQAQVIEAQQEALRELSTPLLPLDQKVVAMPLVGTIDSSRAQLVMETLLEGIAAHQAEVAIVDITGVKVVDTQVAQAIIRAAQAVRLLGAEVLLTGIQPQIAQTLVHLGADMSGIVTRSTLQSGIAYALHGKNSKEGGKHNGNGRRNVAGRK
jgi:anti-anti-sigma regulatory factor